jgi:hypothetical protein
MFFFFIAIVREYCREVGILAGIDALVIPIDCLEFLHQRSNRTMHVAGLI